MSLGWSGEVIRGAHSHVTAPCFSAMILSVFIPFLPQFHRAAFIMRPQVLRSPPVQVAWRFASKLDLRYSIRLLIFC